MHEPRSVTTTTRSSVVPLTEDSSSPTNQPCLGSPAMRGLLLIAVVVGACANGKTGGLDPDGGGSSDDATSTPDTPPLNGFGEPCTDNHQCDSGLCILVGTSGQ